MSFYDSRVRTLIALVCISGCSFFGVQGPIASGSEVPADPNAACTESDTLPALDAIGGAAALAVAGGGFIIEQTSETGELRNFTKYYAGPLVIAAIIYFVSTSVGTNRVERCHEAKGTSIEHE